MKHAAPLLAVVLCVLLVFPALSQGPQWRFRGVRTYRGQPHQVYQSARYGNVLLYVPLYTDPAPAPKRPVTRPAWR